MPYEEIENILRVFSRDETAIDVYANTHVFCIHLSFHIFSIELLTHVHVQSSTCTPVGFISCRVECDHVLSTQWIYLLIILTVLEHTRISLNVSPKVKSNVIYCISLYILM